ncbi:MAG TPA: hypothetical protein VIK21_07875 [Desulfuromonadaceae bacterium]|jgi:hypothetical protein
MLDTNNDLGAALYKTWTEQQRCDEIEKLVIGYRNGIPIGILCKMSEAVAGNRKKARKYLKQFMSEAERKTAVESATGAMNPIVTAFMS